MNDPLTVQMLAVFVAPAILMIGMGAAAVFRRKTSDKTRRVD